MSIVPLVVFHFCFHPANTPLRLLLRGQRSRWLCVYECSCHWQKISCCALDKVWGCWTKMATRNGCFMVLVGDTEQRSGWWNDLGCPIGTAQERFWSEARTAKWPQDTDRKSINTDGYGMLGETCRMFQTNASHGLPPVWSPKYESFSKISRVPLKSSPWVSKLRLANFVGVRRAIWSTSVLF